MSATTEGTRRANVRRALHHRYGGPPPRLTTDELVDAVLAALPAAAAIDPRCAHDGLCDQRDPACITYKPEGGPL